MRFINGEDYIEIIFTDIWIQDPPVCCDMKNHKKRKIKKDLFHLQRY